MKNKLTSIIAGTVLGATALVGLSGCDEGKPEKDTYRYLEKNEKKVAYLVKKNGELKEEGGRWPSRDIYELDFLSKDKSSFEIQYIRRYHGTENDDQYSHLLLSINDDNLLSYPGWEKHNTSHAGFCRYEESEKKFYGLLDKNDCDLFAPCDSETSRIKAKEIRYDSLITNIPKWYVESKD